MPSKQDLRGINSKGLTLLETLVVITIFGVLVGLLLPAVQSSRETARRHACENNLRQIWLGTEAYRFTYRVFPSGTMAEQLPIANFPADNHQGWLLRITPEMSGGANLLSSFDYSRSVYDPVNWPTNMISVSWQVCPSSYYSLSAEMPNSCYVGIYDGRDVPIDADCRGSMVANRFLTEKDFPDGLANTAILSEIDDPISLLGWTSGTIATLRSLGIPPSEHDYRSLGSPATNSVPMKYGWLQGDRSQSYEQFIDSTIRLLLREGAQLASRETEFGSPEQMTLAQKTELVREYLSDDWMFMESMVEDSGMYAGPDSDSLELGEDSRDLEYDVEETLLLYPTPMLGAQRFAAAGVGSFHPSGVNMVFVDGHCRVVYWSVDRKVFATTGIRNDGLPLMQQSNRQ